MIIFNPRELVHPRAFVGPPAPAQWLLDRIVVLLTRLRPTPQTSAARRSARGPSSSPWPVLPRVTAHSQSLGGCHRQLAKSSSCRAAHPWSRNPAATNTLVLQ